MGMATKTSQKKYRSRKAARAPKRDLYADITSRIVAVLEDPEAKLAPWKRPWNSAGLHKNPTTGKAYRGVNQFILQIAAWERGYTDNWWVTFRQASDIAARAAKANRLKVERNSRGIWVFSDGEKKGKGVGGVRVGQNAKNGFGAQTVIFWTMLRREEEKNGKKEETFIPLMRSYSVFNVEQLDDACRKYLKVGEEPEVKHDPIKAAEAIVDGYKIKTTHGGNKAGYSPTKDAIRLPKRSQFESGEQYFSTRFHEMGHSTGHKDRLNRPGIADFDGFGSHQYSEEELVAEFTACFLTGEAGIGRVVEKNSAAYLRHWASKLKEDPRLLVTSAQRAQKAADLIMGRPAYGEKADDESKGDDGEVVSAAA